MFTMKRQIFALLVSSALTLSACATGGLQSKSVKSDGKSVSQGITNILAEIGNVTTVGAAMDGGRLILVAYSDQLKGAQNTRRNINLGVIGTGLYTAIAAGTGAHLHKGLS